METPEVDLGELLSSMVSMLLTAAELLTKDADLPRNDVLGDIDRGAARTFIDSATAIAEQIVELSSTESAVADGGPKMALREIAALLASDTFAIDERRGALLERLLSDALAIPLGLTTGKEVTTFEDTLQIAAKAFRSDTRASR